MSFASLYELVLSVLSLFVTAGQWVFEHPLLSLVYIVMLAIATAVLRLLFGVAKMLLILFGALVLIGLAWRFISPLF